MTCVDCPSPAAWTVERPAYLWWAVVPGTALCREHAERRAAQYNQEMAGWSR